MNTESKVSQISSQAREFANELRASSELRVSSKASKNQTGSNEGSTGSSHGNSTDASTVSDAYAKMLTIFIPLLVDEVKVHNICLFLKLYL